MEFSGISVPSIVLPPGARGLAARYSFVFPRVIGNATATQVLAAIRNMTVAPDTRIVRVVRLAVVMEETAAVTAASSLLRAMRVTASALGGGTDIPKSLSDTLMTGSSVLVTALSATASDATGATPITGGSGTPNVPSADAYGAMMGTTLHTAVGQRFNAFFDLFHAPLILRAGEAVVAQVSPVAAANPATAHYGVLAEVEEFFT